LAYASEMPQDDDDQRPNEVLGLVLLMVATLTMAMATLGSSVILGIYFSSIAPMFAGLPSQAVTLNSSIPTTAFYAYFIITGGIFVTAVIGILHIIFGWGRTQVPVLQ